MQRYRFGEGLYRYFDGPLPDLIQTAREAFYPPLAELANLWAERLGKKERYPARRHRVPLPGCHAAEPRGSFRGGEFVLVEQRPRAQSRAD
jgi:uncharacterized protein